MDAIWRSYWVIYFQRESTQVVVNIADKAKPRVIVGRLPAVIGGGSAWSKDAGGESHGSGKRPRTGFLLLALG